jgi:hypothetical protein
MIYKIAARNKFRFPSVRGDLSVEQLFELPLKSATGFDLDNVARTVNTELKALSEESFVEDTVSTPRKKTLETALEIVKDVIKTKQEENATRLSKAKKAEERKKILDAIGAKKDQQLTQASLEELEKKLAALEE